MLVAVLVVDDGNRSIYLSCAARPSPTCSRKFSGDFFARPLGSLYSSMNQKNKSPLQENDLWGLYSRSLFISFVGLLVDVEKKKTGRPYIGRWTGAAIFGPPCNDPFTTWTAFSCFLPAASSSSLFLLLAPACQSAQQLWFISRHLSSSRT